MILCHLCWMFEIERKQCTPVSWWRHQIETFSALLATCAGNSPVSGEFPAQRPMTRSFDAFFDLRPNKRLSKQWWGWWVETPSSPFWRHCIGYGLKWGGLCRSLVVGDSIQIDEIPCVAPRTRDLNKELIKPITEISQILLRLYHLFFFYKWFK